MSHGTGRMSTKVVYLERTREHSKTTPIVTTLEMSTSQHSSYQQKNKYNFLDYCVISGLVLDTHIGRDQEDAKAYSAKASLWQGWQRVVKWRGVFRQWDLLCLRCGTLSWSAACQQEYCCSTVRPGRQDRTAHGRQVCNTSSVDTYRCGQA